MKTFKDFLEDRMDDLRKALAVHKFKQKGGKIDKQPEGPTFTVRSGAAKYRPGKDSDDPDEKERGKAIVDYRKKTGKQKKKRTGSWRNNEDRDYKDEYKKFQSSPEKIKYRSELVKYNRDKGTYGNGDGLDASHKGGKIAGFEKESQNKGRAEASREKGSSRK
tara:strand:+ start:148 stop:636 length:489 start_codon:yes stop_codon:yes gene_type:complete